MITNTHLYELGWLTFPDMSGIKASFDALPPDDYAEDRLRSRAYSRFRYSDSGQLERLTKKDFMQAKEINNFVGDVERTYEEISDDLLGNIIFLKMFEEFNDRTDLKEDSVIEAHQIRWHCKRKVKEPAPEGTHQDGFDYIAIFMVDTYNVDGGEILLYEGLEDAPCFKKRLENGEFVVLNDKKLFHNAAPLVPTANKEDGHWDVFVLTANRDAA